MMSNQARIDPLTRFFLRDALYPFLQNLIVKASLDNQGFSLALVDLDHFKKFNDKFGHDFGDEVLKYFASTLRLSLQENESYIFRYGGDEFIAVIPGKEPQEALRLLRQCSYNLDHRPFLFQNKLYKITLSCGIAVFPSNGKTIEDLIKSADKAMYFSKRHGRNSATLASSIKYLRIYWTLFFVFACTAILATGLILYRTGVIKQIIQPAINRILGIKTKDVLILKNGAIFEGYIVTEAKDKVVLNLSPKKGVLGHFSGEESLVVFNRQEIAKIKYGSRPFRRNEKP
ncbi:MAG: GGDEF domain-containing protein [Candidatus Omnitrophota bacterium]|jgi:diguanylate cyclase (GGDEF)-like protein